MAVAIAVTRERRDGETRCAVTPETVKKFVSMGATVTVESGTGAGSSIPDDEYTAAGATVAKDTKAVLSGADIVLKVRGPTAQETSALKPGAVVVALLDAYREKETVQALAGDGANGWIAKGAGVAAVTLASVNIFGGFMVTRRMLAMYRKKEKPKAAEAAKA